MTHKDFPTISDFGLGGAKWTLYYNADDRALLKAVNRLLFCEHPHHFVVMQDYNNSIAVSDSGLECLRKAELLPG